MKFIFSFFLVLSLLFTSGLGSYTEIAGDQVQDVKHNAAFIKDYIVTADASNFEDIVLKSGKTSFVKFYADWCGHCKSMQPAWESLALGFKDKEEFQIVQINADKNKKIGKMFGITGYPDLKLFKAEDLDNPINYSGARDYKSFVNFVKAHTGIEARKPKAVGGSAELPKKVASKIVQLHDGSIEKMVERKGKDAFMVFTADWCGHCKNLKPIWGKLADVFHRDLDKVLISEIDTTGDEPTDWLKNRYEIKSFPTIVFIADGKLDEPEIYEGSRTLDELVKFVNGKVGLHRSVDGGLDENAGTLPQLDEKIKKFVGSNRVGRVNMVSDLVSDLRSLDKEKKYTEEIKYYAKLINSLVSGGVEYVHRELDRLTNMIKSGSLNEDSKDSVRMRINALKLFKSYETEQTHELGRDEL